MGLSHNVVSRTPRHEWDLNSQCLMGLSHNVVSSTPCHEQDLNSQCLTGLSQNVVLITLRHEWDFNSQCLIWLPPWMWFEFTTLVVKGPDCITSCKSNYYIFGKVKLHEYYVRSMYFVYIYHWFNRHKLSPYKFLMTCCSSIPKMHQSVKEQWRPLDWWPEHMVCQRGLLPLVLYCEPMNCRK